MKLFCFSLSCTVFIKQSQALESILCLSIFSFFFTRHKDFVLVLFCFGFGFVFFAKELF